MPFTTNHAVIIKSMLLEALCAPEKSTVLREAQLPDAINSVFSNLCAYLKKNIDERYFSKLDGVSVAERIVVCAEDKSAALTKAASTKSKTMGLKVGADEADNDESYDSDSTEYSFFMGGSSYYMRTGENIAKGTFANVAKIIDVSSTSSAPSFCRKKPKHRASNDDSFYLEFTSLLFDVINNPSSSSRLMIDWDAESDLPIVRSIMPKLEGVDCEKALWSMFAEYVNTDIIAEFVSQLLDYVRRLTVYSADLALRNIMCTNFEGAIDSLRFSFHRIDHDKDFDNPDFPTHYDLDLIAQPNIAYTTPFLHFLYSDQKKKHLYRLSQNGQLLYVSSLVKKRKRVGRGKAGGDSRSLRLFSRRYIPSECDWRREVEDVEDYSLLGNQWYDVKLFPKLEVVNHRGETINNRRYLLAQSLKLVLRESANLTSSFLKSFNESDLLDESYHYFDLVELHGKLKAALESDDLSILSEPPSLISSLDEVGDASEPGHDAAALSMGEGAVVSSSHLAIW